MIDPLSKARILSLYDEAQVDARSAVEAARAVSAKMGVHPETIRLWSRSHSAPPVPGTLLDSDDIPAIACYLLRFAGIHTTEQLQLCTTHFLTDTASIPGAELATLDRFIHHKYGHEILTGSIDAPNASIMEIFTLVNGGVGYWARNPQDATAASTAGGQLLRVAAKLDTVSIDDACNILTAELPESVGHALVRSLLTFASRHEIAFTPCEGTAVPIDVLDLSVRATNCLMREGYTTVRAASQLSETELLDIRNMGQQATDEIRTSLYAWNKRWLHQNPATDPA